LRSRGDAALAAIEQAEGRARRAEPGLVAAQLVADARALDPDHLRASLEQDQAGERTRQQRAEVDHLDAGKRLHDASDAASRTGPADI
jgi:hypothetical protein